MRTLPTTPENNPLIIPITPLTCQLVLNSPNTGATISLVPDTINLTISGSQQKVDRIRPENIMAYVRCDELDAATTYDIPVQVDLPDGVILDSTEPSVVKVSIKLSY